MHIKAKKKIQCTLEDTRKKPSQNDKYENFVNARLVKCIPTKQWAKPIVPWGSLAVI